MSQNYDTADAAAKAYVEEEIVGLSNGADNVVATSKGVVTEEKSAQIMETLLEEDKEGIVKIEEYEVSYSESESLYRSVAYRSAAPLTEDTLNKDKTIKVYIIGYADHFKYYTPCPITGETITQSYFNSVINPDAYKNCTFSTVTEEKVKAASQGIEVTLSISIKQTVKFSENAIYMEQSYSNAMVGGGMDNKETVTLCAYVEKNDEGDWSIYVKEGDSTEWAIGSWAGIGVSSLDEIYPFAQDYLDYSYFTKTSYGFELSEENAAQYIKETLDGVDVEQYLGTDSKIDMFAKYYVSNGILSGMRMDLSMDINVVSQGIKVTGSLTGFSETKVTNNGTTVVTKPFTE